MPLFSGDSNVHHHGILAGLGAGTAAVLGCFALILGVWHRVSGTIATAAMVMVIALAVVVLAAAAFAVGFLVLRFRHHVAHPETLARHSLRAEVIPGHPVAGEAGTAVPAAAPAPPIAPVVHNHTWYLPEDPAAVAAAIRAIADGTTERT